MKTTTRRQTLESLFTWLNRLPARAPLGELGTRLRSLHIDLDSVSDHLRFSADRYMRNLVREGRYYHALFLCWRSGQRSPIHDHARSVCGFRILTGTATETVFDASPSGLLKAVSSTDHPVGHVVVSRGSDIHQVSNLQAEGLDLVTLHIYSPPLRAMKSYSITDRHVGEFRPTVDEFTLGSGI